MTKTSKHSDSDKSEHGKCCEHHHLEADCHDSIAEDFHQDLYGERGEVPAVFSHKTLLNLVQEVSGEELGGSLTDWIDHLQQWLHQHQHLIGHIKVFVENGGNFNLWISTTGNKINIKGSTEWQTSRVKSCTLNMTIIVFGIDEDSLQRQTLDYLKKSIVFPSST
jgi:hypothetical protein